MAHIQRNRRTTAAAVLVVLLAGVALAGCGGSSKSSSSTSASTAQTANAPSGRFAGRATALRSCLQKNGVSLPARKPGQHGGPFGAGASGRPRNGVTPSKLQAALKKCGANFRPGRFNGAAAKQRYAKFAACMSRNGVKLPAANTSGNGPIYNTKGIDTTSATFKSAYAKCRAELALTSAAGPGTGGPGGGGPGAAGAPGAAVPQGAQPSAPPSSP